MDVAVFGVGKIFADYKKYLKDFRIISIVDNDERKCGWCIDGVKVILPCKIVHSSFEFIIIMSIYYRSIKEQLVDLGVPEEKIISYTQMGDLLGRKLTVYTGQNQIGMERWGKSAERKKIMLIVPNFSYAGVPIAMLNMARVLKDMQYHVLLVGVAEGGGLVKEIEESQIDYIWGVDIFYRGKQFLREVSRFDMVMVSAIILSDLVEGLSQMSIPLLWWIHESDSGYYKQQYGIILNKNIHLYACSNRVVNILQKYVGRCVCSYAEGTEINKLYYCIPDIFEKPSKRVVASKIVFAIIGVMCSRKAQDILAQALFLLPKKYRDQFELLVIGNTIDVDEDYWQPIENEFLQMREVTLTGELCQNKIREQYEMLDVLICPSRDDPMPVVVTEAMMYGKACIVSENVGQAEFIKEQENGFVFQNENADELAEKMIWVMENRNKIQKIGQAARKIYENYFTEDALQKRMTDIIDDLCL